MLRSPTDGAADDIDAFVERMQRRSHSYSTRKPALVALRQQLLTDKERLLALGRLDSALRERRSTLQLLRRYAQLPPR
jgi:hypothetical protein